MKHVIIASIGLTALSILAACNGQTGTGDQTVTTNGMTVDTTISMPGQYTTVDTTNATAAPLNMQGAPSPNDKPQPARATAQLNPPHGEPGHDCAVPVGAPLNSGNTAPAVAPSSQPANANAKLNPPHGEPGHDCAVPVGAPLKS